MTAFCRIATFLLMTTGIAFPQGESSSWSVPPEKNLVHAEQALREKDFLLAESEFRFAAAKALNNLGHIASSEGKWDEALTAYSEASQNLADPTEPILGVASVYLQQDKAAQAEAILRQLPGASKNARVLQMIAVSYAAQGRFTEARQQASEARRLNPSDPELAYIAAVISIQSGDISGAANNFADLLRLRPGAASHVLVGRTWRDYDRVPEAEHELQEALRVDPRTPRANYYLGTMLLRQPGHVEEGIAAFRRELQIAPDDYLSNLNAGVALLSEHQAEQAVPLLVEAAKHAEQNHLAFYYLGQAQFQAGESAAAVESLKTYLASGEQEPSMVTNLGNAEYVLAEALKALGKDDEAAAHFTRARESKAKYHVKAQEQLQEYMAVTNSSDQSKLKGIWKIPTDPVPSSESKVARATLSEIAARSYFNLGIILSQRQRYRSAAAALYKASTWDPGFPNVQAALGTARFRAGMYDLAMDPLKKALASSSGKREISRLLAVACFQTHSYGCAVELLRGDPGIASNPELQYTLGVSLVNVGQASLAARVFEQLIKRNGGSAELYSLLGDANAQQGDFDAALVQYQRALQLDSRILGANLAAALVLIRQGNLAEAEQHLRAELKSNPTGTRARYHLAYVLERESKKQEAADTLRGLLKDTPAHSNARYLLGRILLDEGDAPGAVEQLEASVRLAPDEPRAHYQLGRAYQKVGRQEDAKKEFALFQQLKHSAKPSIQQEQAQ